MIKLGKRRASMIIGLAIFASTINVNAKEIKEGELNQTKLSKM